MSVVISLDAELSWGIHDRPDRDLYDTTDGSSSWLHARSADKSRDAWSWLVERFEAHSIPCTWAIVGHLFLDSCDGDHPDHAIADDWFARETGGDESTAPEWFAGTLIEAIEDSSVDHEIASQTFSHVEFGKDGVSRDVITSELRRCREVAESWGHELSSLGFPRNEVGYLDEVADHGFDCYRGVSPSRWYEETSMAPVGKALTYSVGRSAPPIVDPYVDRHGLVNVPASLYLFSLQGPVRDALRSVSVDPIVREVRKGIEEVCDRDDGVLHLWFHPNDLREDADFERIERILALLDAYRTERDLTIETMRAVSDRVTAERTGRLVAPSDDR